MAPAAISFALVWSVASVFLGASALGIPTSTSQGLAPRTVQPAGNGTCGIYNGALTCTSTVPYNSFCDPSEPCTQSGASCTCGYTNGRTNLTDGCGSGGFCPSKSGCDVGAILQEAIPINNTLATWCDAGNQIPAGTAVAGTYQEAIVFVCNYLETPIGCNTNEVTEGMNSVVESCGWTTGGWAFMQDWNKLYGIDLVNASFCQNLPNKTPHLI